MHQTLYHIRTRSKGALKSQEASKEKKSKKKKSSALCKEVEEKNAFNNGTYMCVLTVVRLKKLQFMHGYQKFRTWCSVGGLGESYFYKFYQNFFL